MANVGEMKAALIEAATALEGQAAILRSVSQKVHAERNVLNMTLEGSTYEACWTAIRTIGVVQDNAEDGAADLIRSAAVFRVRAAML